MLRILTISSLFPNAVQRRHGVFVRERLGHLVAMHPVQATVVAPVPWFPFRNPRFGKYGVFAQVPPHERNDRWEVLHPRYLVIPKVSGAIMPLTYAAAVSRALKKLPAFDLIDAHFAYPDGAAALLVGRNLGVPVVITVRGSDINLMPDEPAAGRWIRWALRGCDAIVGVSDALSKECVRLSGRLDGVVTISNGVDAVRFCVADDREELRQRYGFGSVTVLSVGNLIGLKGHDLVIDAVARLPEVNLVIIGDGPMRQALIERAVTLGISDRVQFMGEVAQSELIGLYNAADFTVLASSHEGMPNVVLESLACGTPVLANPVGGIPEVMQPGIGGVFLQARTADSVQQGLRDMIATPWCRERVRASVTSYDWRARADRLYALFKQVATRARYAANEVEN